MKLHLFLFSLTENILNKLCSITDLLSVFLDFDVVLPISSYLKIIYCSSIQLGWVQLKLKGRSSTAQFILVFRYTLSCLCMMALNTVSLLKKCRYLIQCALRVSGIIFIRNCQSQTILRLINQKDFGSIKIKGPKQDSQIG